MPYVKASTAESLYIPHNIFVAFGAFTIESGRIRFAVVGAFSFVVSFIAVLFLLFHI